MTKTISIKRRLALLLVLAFTCVAQGWAGSNTYYAKLTAKATPTGSGKVYVSTSSTEQPTSYTAESASATGSQNVDWGMGESDPGSADVTLYAFAKANDGYRFQGWSESEGGAIVQTSTTYSKTITSKSSSESSPTESTIYAQFVEIANNTITFLAPTNGSYTASDGTNTITNSGEITTENAITLKATAGNGYKIFGWYTTDDHGATKNYFSTDATVENYTFSTSTSVGCDFVKEDVPVFRLKDGITPYTDLNAADQAATAAGGKTIVLVSNSTLPKGDYTISSGNTLLIPFDDACTIYGEDGPASSHTDNSKNRKAYRTLTMANGANLSVSGTLNVSAQMYSAAGGGNGGGSVNGPYGLIKMEEGSKITINGNGNLFAWGYISGKGTVEALSDATVYEDFQINDFRGGSATSSMSNKVFPFNQYYIQNIEVPLTINYGATEITYSSLYAAKSVIDRTQIEHDTHFTFIGKDAGLFRLKEGAKLTKSYDAVNDRQVYVIEGDASLESITINVAGMSANSSSYVLPITNNLTITQKSGTLTVSSDCALLPGAEATIAESANLKIASDKSLYVYDAAEWGQYAGAGNTVKPVTYTVASKGTNRSDADLEDSEIKVQGTLTATGNLYTTATGAAVKCENGTGKVVFTNAAPTATTTYQYTQEGTSVTAQPINVTSAQLQNADGTYIKTEGSAAGTTFYYGVDPEGKMVWVSDEASTDVTTMANKLKNVSLVEASTTAPTTYNSNVYVTYTRTFKTGWNALVLPFATTVKALGADEVVEFIGSTGDKSSVTMNFRKDTTLEANKPYMVWFESDPQELHFVAPVVPTDQPTTIDSNEAFDYVGSFIALGKKWDTTSPIKKGDYIVSASGLTRAKGGNNLSAFRAYFRAYEGMQDAKIGMAINDDEVTGIKAIDFENMLKGDGSETVGNGTMYNLSGQKVDGSYKGIVIMNGKKILMK